MIQDTNSSHLSVHGLAIALNNVGHMLTILLSLSFHDKLSKVLELISWLQYTQTMH